MAKTTNQIYKETNYDQILVRVKKGKREEYRQSAKDLGLGQMEMIRLAVEEFIQNHAGENFSVPVTDTTAKSVPEKKLTAAERRLVEAFARLPEKTRAKFAGLIDDYAKLADLVDDKDS